MRWCHCELRRESMADFAMRYACCEHEHAESMQESENAEVGDGERANADADADGERANADADGVRANADADGVRANANADENAVCGCYGLSMYVTKQSGPSGKPLCVGKESGKRSVLTKGRYYRYWIFPWF